MRAFLPKVDVVGAERPFPLEIIIFLYKLHFIILLLIYQLDPIARCVVDFPRIRVGVRLFVWNCAEGIRALMIRDYPRMGATVFADLVDLVCCQVGDIVGSERGVWLVFLGRDRLRVGTPANFEAGFVICARC